MRKILWTAALGVCLGGVVGAGCASTPVSQEVEETGEAEVRLRTVPLLDSPVKGSADGPIAVVAFVTIPCADCAVMREAVEELQRQRPDDVQFVYKHAPRDDLPQSWAAARLLEAAHRQGAFWEMEAALTARMDEIRRGSTRQAGEDIAEELGLNMRQFRADFDNMDVAGRVERDHALALSLEVRHNPTLFINGQVLVAPRRTRQVMEKVAEVDALLAELRADGVAEGDLYEVSVAASQRAQRDAEERRTDAVEVEVLLATMAEVIVEERDLIYGETEDFLVTLVEFSNPECTFSGDSAATVRELAAAYGDELRLVYKPFPLDMHVHSVEASQALLAANRQGQGSRMLMRLFDQQERLGEAGLYEELAGELGLDLERFGRDLVDPALEEEIWASERSARSLKVVSTPEFYINGRRVVGAQSFDYFRAILEDELLRARGMQAESGLRGEELYMALLADERDAAYWRDRAEAEAEAAMEDEQGE